LEIILLIPAIKHSRHRRIATGGSQERRWSFFRIRANPKKYIGWVFCFSYLTKQEKVAFSYAYGGFLNPNTDGNMTLSRGAGQVKIRGNTSHTGNIGKARQLRQKGS